VPLGDSDVARVVIVHGMTMRVSLCHALVGRTYLGAPASPLM
jgi:hypothetical protein